MARRADPPAGVAITGASGGLGRALALAHARPGATLALFGRDRARLEEAAGACEARGAAVTRVLADVTDRAAIREALTAFDRATPLDLLIANAGASSGRRPDGAIEDAEAALRVLNVNVLGVAHAVLPAVELMLARGAGQIAVIGSLSARPPLPFAPAYSASKAAVETYGAALRQELRGRGVRVNVVSPGFVESAMSARVLGPHPLQMSAERAAQIIQTGLAADRARIAFPWPLALGASLAALLPAAVGARLAAPFAFRVKPDWSE